MRLNQVLRWGLPLCLTCLGLQPIAHAERPYGAGFYDTSEFALGTYVWNVVFTQSEGSSSVWTQSKINTHKQRIRQAANWWEQKARDRFLPGINWLDIQVNFATPTVNDVAVVAKSNDVYSYVDAVKMLDPSIRDTFWHAAVTDFNNNTRDAFGKNWAFTTFVSPWSSRASAYLNGPLTNAYNDDNWHTYKHEMAHIFGALDEYRDGSRNHTGEVAGYLGAQNTNAAVHEDGSTNRSSHTSLMNTTNSTRFSYGALGGIGWWDRDNDQIPDILDTFPEIGSILTSASATDTGSFFVSLLAEVDRLERTGIGTDITINTLASARYRVDGGSWVDLLAADGDWGDYQESLNFEISGLSRGNHLIDLELYNSVGNFTSEQFEINAVPEPASLVLLGLAATAFLHRRRA